MNTPNQLTEVLTRELSAESMAKLRQLYDFINSHKEHKQYAQLSEAISQDRIIQQIFRHAKSFQENKLSHSFYNYYNNHEVMTAFGISKRTLSEWRSCGILPYIVFRNICYYRIEDLIELLAQNYTGTDGDLSIQTM